MSAYRRIRVARVPDHQGSEPEVPIQRDGPLTLQTPSLGQTRDPASKYNLGVDTHLELDPAVLAMIRQVIEQQLDPARLRPALNQVNLNVPPPAQTGAGANPLSGPAVPQAKPLVPAGAGPSEPRQAELSDVAGAILKVPAIDQGITHLRTQATDLVLHDWKRLNTGEKIGVVSTVAVIGAGALAGIGSNPDLRQAAINLLNGRVIPVPGVDWLHLEVNSAGNGAMVGLHVDVGALLPKNLGFGAGDPNAIGGPPVQRSEHSGSGSEPGQLGGGVAAGIRGLSGQGSPLRAPIRERLEHGVGANLAAVRVHTGAVANELAEAVQADAFTTGRDIFFRAGAFDPGSKPGMRLIAHEVIHTLQQASGPVAGTAIRDGSKVSHPSDPHERQARQGAEHLVREPPGHHIGRIRIHAAG